MNFTIGDTPEQLNIKLAHTDSALIVDGFVYTQESVRQLKAECLRLDSCLTSKTDIANQLKDGLADAFEREMNLKAERDALEFKLAKHVRLRKEVIATLNIETDALENTPLCDLVFHICSRVDEIRAEAGRAGYLQALEDIDSEDDNKWTATSNEEAANQYAEKIRQGGVK